MSEIKDMTGTRFGRLTVIKQCGYSNPTPSGHRCVTWLCRCDCGRSVVVRSPLLKSGNTKSCGCLRKETTIQKNTTHNMSHQRIYRTYRKMKDRCYNPKDKFYKDYGGRGICVCDEWKDKHGFTKFYEWAIQNGYSDDLTIDRINVDGNYEPNNCRWATNGEQANNKRNSRKITWNGETHTLREWGRIQPNGLKYTTLVGRLYNGWDIQRIFETNRYGKEKKA